jgi:hypothetical protein
MGAARKRAEEIFRREHPNRFPFCPYARAPQLSDLWPCDQEKYIERAEAELRFIDRCENPPPANEYLKEQFRRFGST